MRRLAPLLAFAGALLCLPTPGQDTTAKIQPLIGQTQTYTVQRGDTLTKIARRKNINRFTLARLNHLTRQRPRPGRVLMQSQDEQDTQDIVPPHFRPFSCPPSGGVSVSSFARSWASRARCSRGVCFWSFQ